MVRLLGYPLVALALFAMAGGHWAVLQTVAWAGMVVEYSQKAGLHQGVAETFDGEHPCPMCRHIAKSRTQEEKHDPLAVTVKMAKKAEAVASVAGALPSISSSSIPAWRVEAEVGLSRAEPPALRPPRGVLSFPA